MTRQVFFSLLTHDFKLCVHVPYERMPADLYDKYYTEEGWS